MIYGGGDFRVRPVNSGSENHLLKIYTMNVVNVPLEAII